MLKKFYLADRNPAARYPLPPIIYGDIYFDYVTLYATFDGVANVNTKNYKDEVPGHVYTTQADNFQRSTAQKMPGRTTSLDINNAVYTTDRIYMTDPQMPWVFTDVDFTMECWVYMLSGYSSSNRYFFSTDANSSSRGFYFGLLTNYTAIPQFVYANQNSTIKTIRGDLSEPVLINQWNHVAICRKDGVFNIYTNGIKGPDYDHTGDKLRDTKYQLNIGNNNDFRVSGAHCYMQDLRITRGICRYTESFIPEDYYPPVKTVDEYGGLNGGYVVECLRGHGTSASNMVGDNGRNWTPVVSTTSATAAAWGRRTILCTTASHYVYTAHTTDFDFLAEDFTIDTWYLFSDLSAQRQLCGIWSDSTASQSFRITMVPPGYIKFEVRTSAGVFSVTSADVVIVASNVTISWHHIAVQRHGALISVWVNGVFNGSTDIGTDPLIVSTGELRLFRTQVAGEQSLTGRIEQFRITKGVSRYTENEDFFPMSAKCIWRNLFFDWWERGPDSYLLNDGRRLRNLATNNHQSATFGPVLTAGKWYMEFKREWAGFCNIGIEGGDLDWNAYVGRTPLSWGWSIGGALSNNGAPVVTLSPSGQGDVVMVALDLDNGYLYLGLNGTWENSSDPATNTNPVITGLLALSENFRFACSVYSTDSSVLAYTNHPDYPGFDYTPPAGYAGPFD